MKNSYLSRKSRIKGFSAFSALILTVTFLAGCSKDEDPAVGPVGEGTELVINVVNVEEQDVIGPFAKKQSVGSDHSIASLVGASATSSVQNDVGFAFEAVAQQRTIPVYAKKAAKLVKFAKSSSGLRAEATPLTDGFTYRIQLYHKDSDGVFRFVKAENATSGDELKIDVIKGDTYKWVAYSYNNTEELGTGESETTVVEAPTNKDLLYASDEVTIPNTPKDEYTAVPINILFQHQMAKVSPQLDATNLALYADVQHITATFTQELTFTAGSFNIQDGAMTATQDTVVKALFDENTPKPIDNIWEKNFYTVDPSNLTSYGIEVSDLPVTFKLVEPSIADVNLVTFTNQQQPVAPELKSTFSFENPAIGKELLGTVNLGYILQPRKILHIGWNDNRAFMFQNGTPWKMITDPRNFGNTAESIVRMRPYAPGSVVWKGGTATGAAPENMIDRNTPEIASELPADGAKFKERLTNPNTRPDIIVIAYDQYTFSNAAQDALVDFVNSGGILIWMNEFRTTSVNQLLNKLFDLPANGPMKAVHVGGPGYMYPLLNVDDHVLNGPFGDARGKLWGEDGSETHGVLNVPADKVIIYSYADAVNAHVFPDRGAATMFRHKEKNFYYLGDGGLINALPGNEANSTAIPFLYDEATAKPIPKPYGFAGDGYGLKSQKAYNGIIAGNIMLWAGAAAEFHGVDRWKYTPDNYNN